MAARLGSFKLASEALNVTPSAISQQIKSLEQRIGMALFSRQGKELRLNQAGKEFLLFASTAVDVYESGWKGFSEQFLSRRLRVSMTDYMANCVVIPRLKSLEADTGIELEIHTSSRNQDLQIKTLDAAIRFGEPPWPEHQFELISEASVAIVASPDYWRRHPLSTKQDWLDQTLIHARRSVNDWRRTEIFNAASVSPKNELVFDSYHSAIEAAKNGLGIMLASFPISNQEIRSGAVAALSEKRYPCEEGFYLVTKPNHTKDKQYQLLLAWLRKVFSDLDHSD